MKLQPALDAMHIPRLAGPRPSLTQRRVSSRLTTNARTALRSLFAMAIVIAVEVAVLYLADLELAVPFPSAA